VVIEGIAVVMVMVMDMDTQIIIHILHIPLPIPDTLEVVMEVGIEGVMEVLMEEVIVQGIATILVLRWDTQAIQDRTADIIKKLNKLNDQNFFIVCLLANFFFFHSFFSKTEEK